MGMTEIFGLLGGLAFFLYGMQMMSEGLEDAAGNRMKQILEKLTANRFLGVLVGAGFLTQPGRELRHSFANETAAPKGAAVGFMREGD